WKTLFDGIAQVLASPANKGEFYLTDAFQYMVDRGKKILTAEVQGWYDCGKVDTLLETNAHVLKTGRARKPAIPAGVTIREPVYIEDGVTLKDSVIGPNVSLGAGSVVERSTLENSIVGRRVRVADCTISGSVVGNDQVLHHSKLLGMVASGGEVAKAR
ncbi:MAG TPA: hypothetical protein VH113_11180, partial [Gemmatimonadales bacterium]|nr:hypothetical protein [Gemmatimonadales bacterium]